MPTELLQILKEYQYFEAVVQQQIKNICAPHCSVCKQVCCRPEYCCENIDSPFLTLLNSNTMRNAAFSAESGWLTSSGCALSIGRPPVCYQFNCNTTLDALPDDAHRYFLKVLSNLVPHIGKRSLGNRHLVEIMDAADLKRVKIARFRKRLAEALRALQRIQSINGNRIPLKLLLEDLSKIVPIPQSLAG